MNRSAVLLAALAGAAVLAAAGGAGWWVLTHPANPLTAFFSGKVSLGGSRVISGPYPERGDLEKLRAAGVGTVVSLLNPAIPYEKALLSREAAAADELGLRLLNFPMGSVLGRSFGEGYERSAQGAAAAVQAAPGKVYLHCYLGMHRIKAVLALLKGAGQDSSPYVRSGERGPDALALDEAEALFRGGAFDRALERLSSIRAPSPAASVLRGWCQLKLGRLDQAASAFEAAPSDASALLGLGFTRRRQGRGAEAAALFRGVLALEPSNREAREALEAAKGR